MCWVIFWVDSKEVEMSLLEWWWCDVVIDDNNGDDDGGSGFGGGGGDNGGWVGLKIMGLWVGV